MSAKTSDQRSSLPVSLAPVHAPIYLDHHATTPVAPDVLDAMLPYFATDFGNAASKDHVFGARSDAAVETARMNLARLIGARNTEIIFTSGATEANNLALFGVMESYANRGNHLITVVTEHKAVLDSAHRLEQLGKRVTYLPVDSQGVVDLDGLRKAITPETVLISIMAANNEIGTLAPLAEIGRIAHEHEVLFHTDATQAVGHIPIDVEKMEIDLLSLSAHKFYGPKGIGALFVRRRHPRVKLTPIQWGGGHERGMRSGTLNVPAIVGLGKAAVLAGQVMFDEARRLTSLRDRLLMRIQEQVGEITLNGQPTHRLPHNLNIFISGVEAKSLIIALPDIAFSTGAACTTEHVEPSHVIEALRLGVDRPHRSIRFGLGRSTILNEIDYTVARVGDEINRLRRLHI